ncbi:MAG TPA: ABC transporter permease [Pyrinomonadaceae bacterium]|nr:ABC transporter permease [Pyrinomonadaceae bacterium]
MRTLLNDVRFALRRLAKSKGFTAVAVASLALGIGANVAIFSVVNAVLIRPLPFPEAERLVMVWEDNSALGFPRDTPAPANYADWKAQNQSFEDMAALATRSFNITGDGEPEKVSAYRVTANLFGVLGVRPAVGRAFNEEDDRPGAAKVVILNYGLWQRRYGGERSVVGRDILLDGEKHTVVGVMPKGFQFMESYTGLWVPAAFTPEEMAARGSHYLVVVARMKPGVSAEQAHADVAAITERIAREFPAQAQNLKAAVVPLREQITGNTRRPLILLLAAVALVLLIACANVANLLLARSASRRKEMAVRTALGASRARVVRQLLTESVLLSVLGGAAGLLLAAWGFEFLKKLIPDGMTLSSSLTIDLPVLGYALGVSLLTGIVFGLAPALQSSRVELNEALKQGGGRSASGGGGGRLRSALVVVEVALALVLLVGAGLLVQTVSNLRYQYALFEPERLLTVRTVLPQRKYTGAAQRANFYDRVLERVRALPGVVSAGYTTSVPLQWKGGANGLFLEGVQLPPGVFANANHRQVSAGYLQTMGIPLREGRYIEETDDARALPVVVVNETMARQYWQGQSAVGRRLKFGPDESADDPWRTVVGVVADVRQMGLDAPVKAEAYYPYKQITTHPFFAPRDLVVRAEAGDPLSLVPAVRREVHAVDPDQPLSSVATMDKVLGDETGSRGTGMVLLAALAGLAVLLAAIGIYGVLAYFVTQHVPEIGVRLALGARPRDILALVLRKGMGLALGGVLAGLAAAYALTRLMESLLFGVSATDPLTFGGLALLLAAVALVACVVPARRATRVDPMTALRYE